MFTERGGAGVGRVGRFRGLTRGFERRAGTISPSKLGMLRVQDHLARFEMRIAGDFRDVGDRRAWHAGVAQQLEPMVARRVGEMALQNRLELRVIRGAFGVELRSERRSSAPALPIASQKRSPIAFIARARDEISVGRAKLLEGRDRRMPRAERSRHLAGRRIARERVLEHRDLAIEHRDIDRWRRRRRARATAAPTGSRSRHRAPPPDRRSTRRIASGRRPLAR